MTNPLIKCENLSKSYGGFNVLRSVNFQIARGKLVGFLGPNGAGKTTTIRILLGLLTPTSGTCEIFGKSCQLDGKTVRSKVGYLPGDVHLYSNLTGRRMLNFIAAARRVNCSDEIERVSSTLDLDLDRKIRKYSTGMRQKLGLIQAIMHKPELVILDEPTSALDPLIRIAVFKELQSIVREGRSVVFSSHSLSEVEELCDEVIVLREGQIVEQQSIDKLRGKALRRVQVVFKPNTGIPAVLPDEFVVLDSKEDSVTGNWRGELNELTQWIATYDLKDLTIAQPDLNDLFLTYYQEQGEEA